MRVLIVSNLYPPHYVGGYELRCRQVARHLHRAGHETRVVTSSARVPGVEADEERSHAGPDAPTVERWLRYHPFDPFPRRRLRSLAMTREQLAEARRFSRLLQSWKPDVVFWWNLEGVTKTVMSLPAFHGVPDACFIEDSWLIREVGARGERITPSWPEFWRGVWGPPWLRPLLRRATTPWAYRVQREGIATRARPPAPRHVCFVSEFLQQEHAGAGLELASTSVIHGGVDTDEFHVRRTADDFARGPLKLLYAGYVEPQRGLHTIIAALASLSSDVRQNIRLSIAQTDPPNPSRYLQEIKESVTRMGLSKQVTFIGKHAHDAMPAVYAAHHVLVSATTRIEGLPLSMTEAMCAGCAVVTTGSGGAIEIAQAADLPMFPREDSGSLSALIARMEADRAWTFAVAARGQRVVLERFTLSRMNERIASMLAALT